MLWAGDAWPVLTLLREDDERVELGICRRADAQTSWSLGYTLVTSVVGSSRVTWNCDTSVPA